MLLSLVASLLIATRLPARADDFTNKSDQFLKHCVQWNKASQPVSAIVQFNDKFPVADQIAIQMLNGVIYQRLPLIHAVGVRLPTGMLNLLAKLPFVSHISQDVVVQKHDQFTVGSSRASTAWNAPYKLDGSGVTVAVLDSGYRSHPDVPSSRVLANVSFVSDGYNTDDPCGHGTHVIGIIAGSGAASSGMGCYRTFNGIARNANIVNVRVLDANGAGTVSTVISGIQWVLANQATYNIRVMNLSLGHPIGESYTQDPLCQAVEQAWQAGIVVVCAAGNNGRLNATTTTGMDNSGYGTNYGSIEVPGNDPDVITVGAMKNVDGKRADDTIASYSSRGPTMGDLVLKPDIVAPGNQVISLRSAGSYLDTTYASTNLVQLGFYKLFWGSQDQSQYFQLSGTSMATPVVSGAAALLLQQNPNLSPDTVKARLMVSADKWSFSNGQYDPCTFGAGYLDIANALTCTVTPTQTALSPTLVSDGQGNIYMNNVIWGSNVIWGTTINNLNVIWGTNVVWGNNVIWGTNVVWGNNVIWGTNVVWGNNVIWGTNVVWGQTANASDLNMTSVLGDEDSYIGDDE